MSEGAFWVVIPAAGVGSRMRADRPKQYLPLAGRTVIEQTLKLFLEHPAIRGIVVAIQADDTYWGSLASASQPRIKTVVGGEERADSVRNALAGLLERAAADDWVMVHDAARPLLTAQDLERLMESLRDHPIGGILATRARDTMKRVGADGAIEATVDRADLWHAQTPQMFRYGILRRCLQDAADRGWMVTDEASAIEQAGLRPLVVEGRADNIKITTPEDLAYAQWLLDLRSAETL